MRVRSVSVCLHIAARLLVIRAADDVVIAAIIHKQLRMVFNGVRNGIIPPECAGHRHGLSIIDFTGFAGDRPACPGRACFDTEDIVTDGIFAPPCFEDCLRDCQARKHTVLSLRFHSPIFDFFDKCVQNKASFQISGFCAGRLPY